VTSPAAQRRALGELEPHHHEPGILRDTLRCPACAAAAGARAALDFPARELVESSADAPDWPAPQVPAPRAARGVARGARAPAAPRGGEGSGRPDDVGVGAAGPGRGRRA